MRPVIAVDGSHLKGRFGGTIFIATAQDGNEQGALGHIDDLVFIFDRHASIEAEISKVFLDATHTICCWHFIENMNKQFQRNDVAAIVDKTIRSYTELKYNLHMEELRNLHQMHMIMPMIPVPTSGPVYTVQKEEFIRNMIQRWFHDRYRVAQSMHHQLTDTTHPLILKSVEKCAYMTINPVGWNIFSVKRSGKQWTVDLARKTCTCNKLQMDMFPCSHALAAARERNLDFTSLCTDFHKIQIFIDAYSIPIMIVGHSSYWVVPADITERVVLNPLSKRQAGHPRGSRHASALKRTTTQSCRRCGQSGHNARRCPNPYLIMMVRAELFLRNIGASLYPVI
ncbi:hypothetical protein Ddye_006121 [Dipteronia dyeriana]|uniref:SWIM-type domain-containing protein n=1 Tax=Dipteronia dyeriana TaxID=168575 RepID=A0AAD9XIF5_9ROSI|nr:hypothetical protein Ddye_006121 [Dipteronia dyeriana]